MVFLLIHKIDQLRGSHDLNVFSEQWNQRINGVERSATITGHIDVGYGPRWVAVQFGRLAREGPKIWDALLSKSNR